MKVIVDRDKCQDHGQCVFSAPEVFEVDADGVLVVLNETPDESQRDSIEEAMGICPTQAITIED